MSEHVAFDCLAIRATKGVDATSVETKVTVHSLLRLAAHLHMGIDSSHSRVYVEKRQHSAGNSHR